MEGGSKSRGLGKGEKLNQALVISTSFLLISGDKTVQLFIYEATIENLENVPGSVRSEQEENP